MAALTSKSIYQAVVAKVLTWGALAVCLTTSPLAAQNIIGGNFTLNENTRFGNTVLGAGQYNFSIEPVGTLQSVRSIRQGVEHLVLVVLKPARSGPIATMFAMASPSEPAHNASELILKPDREELLAQTMYLDKEGLTVNFHWWSPTAPSPGVALKITPQQSAAGPRARGTE